MSMKTISRGYTYLNFSYFGLERGEREEKERKRNIHVKEKHAFCKHPDRGRAQSLQPRHGHWQRTEPVTFQFAGQHPIS